MSSTAASRGDLFTTTDGGKTWSALRPPPIAGRIQFFPDLRGWIVGGVHHGELYRTLDGGQSWTRSVVSLPDQVQPYTKPQGLGTTYVSQPFYEGPYFQTEQNGVLAVVVHVAQTGNDAILTYSTNDGGSTWQVQKTETGLPGVAHLTLFDSAYAELKNLGGGMLSIRRGSLNLTPHLPKDSPQNIGLQKSEFLDANHGWLLLGGGCSSPGCLSGDSALIATQDGGKTLTMLLKSTQVQSAKPLIGGATGLSGIGIDSCQDIPSEYINSLYGPYGQTLPKYPNYYNAYGFYLGGVTAVAAHCSIADSFFINDTRFYGLVVSSDLGWISSSMQRSVADDKQRWALPHA